MYLGPVMATAVFPYVSILAGSVVGSYVFGASFERINGIQSFNRYRRQWDWDQDTELSTRYLQEDTQYQEQIRTSTIDLISNKLKEQQGV